MGTTVPATSLIHIHSGHNDSINRFKNMEMVSNKCTPLVTDSCAHLERAMPGFCLLEKFRIQKLRIN